MKVDLNAKRVCEKKTSVFGVKEFKDFLIKFPEHKGLTKKEFTEIIRTFNYEMIEETKRNINGVTFPLNIGVIRIVNKGVMKHRPINYKESLAHGKIIRHRNFETDNNIMGIMYSSVKKGMNIKNGNVYIFSAMKFFRRDASEYFKKNWARVITYRQIK